MSGISQLIREGCSVKWPALGWVRDWGRGTETALDKYVSSELINRQPTTHTHTHAHVCTHTHTPSLDLVEEPAVSEDLRMFGHKPQTYFPVFLELPPSLLTARGSGELNKWTRGNLEVS